MLGQGTNEVSSQGCPCHLALCCFQSNARKGEVLTLVVLAVPSHVPARSDPLGQHIYPVGTTLQLYPEEQHPSPQHESAVGQHVESSALQTVSVTQFHCESCRPNIRAALRWDILVLSLERAGQAEPSGKLLSQRKRSMTELEDIGRGNIAP